MATVTNKSGRPSTVDEPNLGESNSVGDNINGIPVESYGAGAGTGSNSSGEPAKRGRGRPPGTGTKSTVGTAPVLQKTSRTDDLEVLSGAIYTVHEIAAVALRVEELGLDENESMMIAKSLKRLQAFYPHVDVPAQALAWIGLAATCGKVYGPRVATFNIRRKNERDAKKGPVNISYTRP